MKQVLLVCGTGASSGFMAKNIRIAAKDAGINMSIKARSDAEVEDYIEDIDLLLVGPHLKYMLGEMEGIANRCDVPVRLIDADAYGSLDGKAVLDFIIEIIGK